MKKKQSNATHSKLGEYMKERDNNNKYDILPCGCSKVRCKCQDCHRGLTDQNQANHIRCCAEHKD